jgi:hypothetical protein
MEDQPKSAAFSSLSASTSYVLTTSYNGISITSSPQHSSVVLKFRYWTNDYSNLHNYS